MINIVQNPYKSVVVEDEDGELVTISEGDKIRFCLESGEVKKGTVTKFQGKGDKLNIQIIPENKECQEIWSQLQMIDGSLKLEEDEE